MKVSVIITCFDREKYIERAIRSALSQRFPRPDFEVIVVDDGSTDHSPDIIAGYGDEVVFLRHDTNRGLPAARNTGIRRARGRFVVNLDSDDYLHEELIHVEQLHLALNPHWGAVACDYFTVNDQEEHLERLSAIDEPIACGVMFRKDLLVDLGLYDEDLRLFEDEDLRRRFTAKYTIGHLQLPLYRYRRHGHNLTNDLEAMEFYKDRLENRHKEHEP